MKLFKLIKTSKIPENFFWTPLHQLTSVLHFDGKSSSSDAQLNLKLPPLNTLIIEEKCYYKKSGVASESVVFKSDETDQLPNHTQNNLKRIPSESKIKLRDVLTTLNSEKMVKTRYSNLSSEEYLKDFFNSDSNGGSNKGDSGYIFFNKWYRSMFSCKHGFSEKFVDRNLNRPITKDDNDLIDIASTKDTM